VHRGFWIGSIISIVGFFAVAFFYLRFDAAYLATNPWRRRASRAATGGAAGLDERGYRGLDLRPALTCLIGVFLAVALNKGDSYYTHTGPRRR